METGELRQKIKESVSLLEGYRGFSPMVDEAISSLRLIDDCVAEPTPRKMEESRLRLTRLTQEIGPYRGYVPLVAATLDELALWFRQATP